MKAVLLDLDGTIIDSADDIALALKRTLREIYMEDKMPADVRKLVGGGVKALLEKVLGDDFREEYVDIFRKHYMNNPVVYTKPYKGIPEVLRTLKKRGLKLAVVSNKLEELSVEILKRLKLLDLFEVVVGGDSFSEKKPSPLPVSETLKLLGAEPASSVMVGDTETDLLAGKGAGTLTALAMWGYINVKFIEPDYKLSTPYDLLNLTSLKSDAL